MFAVWYLLQYVYYFIFMMCFEIGMKALQVYIFDDTDPDETTYLGVARVPLITLAHDKPIQGTFELIKVFSNMINFIHQHQW